MRDYATNTLETPADRRVRLLDFLNIELGRRGYGFFNIDASPKVTPDLRENEFEFARTIRRLPNSGFLWRNANYSVAIAGKFDLKDSFKAKVKVKGKDELGVIERMVSDINDRYSLNPITEFEVKLVSPDYEIWTTFDYRDMFFDSKGLGKF
ncbi:MAG: hypothetical protein Q7R87_04210 [Nanoarchaeota archaeon]|nr:hypothetical protein [Nanoarchaeota archaeon]